MFTLGNEKIVIKLSGGQESLDKVFEKNFDPEDKKFFYELGRLRHKFILSCIGIRAVYGLSNNLYVFARIKATGEIDSKDYIEDYGIDPFRSLKVDYAGGPYLIAHQYGEYNDKQSKDILSIQAFFQGKHYVQTTDINYSTPSEGYTYRGGFQTRFLGVSSLCEILPINDGVGHPLGTIKDIVKRVS
jgi:hypothetical protein